MMPTIPASWHRQVGGEVGKDYFRRLEEFVEREREEFEVYPAEGETFQALELTPFRKVSVVLLGQDPYPGPGQAHGLCFSVKPGVRVPGSLRNIFKELQSDIPGFRVPNNGYLASWARQGILMLNTVLTVRAGAIGSHRGHGWETFTDAVIEKVNAKKDALVFLLWGRDAQSKADRIDERRHVVLRAAHPSPLSARHGFFGTRPFSAVNRVLREAGKPEIDWQIPDI
ncbi:MAG: uracil-DNA glycosylase [Acidobacteriota bacterium]|jgi:uracil-DNA glycosylase|nr:uracil-DNA glycosylase [Acidobacteriota bacterium]